MSIEIKVPALPESVTEASVLTWHKKVGDSVARDENLVDLETDKVVLEVPSLEAGVISAINHPEGDIVTAGAILAVVTASGAAAAPVAVASTDAPAAPVTVAADQGAKAAIDINVPVLPESVTEATMLDWRKKAGDSVTAGETIVELETDKVVLEVPATESGVLSEILIESGAIVTANDVIAKIIPGATATASVQTAAPVAASSDSSDDLCPSVKAMVAENNIDVSQIKGTGKDGRLTKEDLINHQEKPAAAPSKPAAASASTATVAATGMREVRRVPMTRMRQTIANRLVQSQQTAAILTTFNEVDMTEVMALRSRYKEDFTKKHDVKLGFMSFFVKASIEGLKRFPVINAYVEDKDVVYHDYNDVGIAVASPRGLVVPVIRNAESKSFAQIEGDIAAYAVKAKAGTISMDDMTGGTFTITNGGTFGSLLSTPIINPPQSGILGMHSIQQRPMAINGEVKIRPMMYVALSYDHRIIDGAEAVQFLVTLKNCLEDPGRLLLNV